MSRYFFDVTDGGILTRDEIGADLASDDEARDEALGLLPNLAREVMPGGDQHEIRTTVRNEDGAVVYEATLSLIGRWWPGRR